MAAGTDGMDELCYSRGHGRFTKREETNGENEMEPPISLAASEEATSPFPASSLTIQETQVTNKYLL